MRHPPVLERRLVSRGAFSKAANALDERALLLSALGQPRGLGAPDRRRGRQGDRHRDPEPGLQLEKIQEADAKARAERFQTMKDLQTQIFDLANKVTAEKERHADRFFHKYDVYIQSNAGTPDVVATLQDADAGLSAMFPPQATAAARAARARAAQVGGPAASAILHSMSKSRPSTGDAKAYRDAFALASSPTPSLDRGRARLLLTIATIIGRRVLVHDLGSAKTFTIASASARVPARGERRLTLKATALGGRALRVLALSPRGAIKLPASSRGHRASRAIAVG
jgi:hypothetical protein